MDPKTVAHAGLLASVVVPLLYTWRATGFVGQGDLVAWLVSAGLITLGVAGVIGFSAWRWTLAGRGDVHDPKGAGTRTRDEVTPRGDAAAAVSARMESLRDLPARGPINDEEHATKKTEVLERV